MATKKKAVKKSVARPAKKAVARAVGATPALPKGKGVADYLNLLVADAKARARHKRNPKGAMAAAGLTATDQKVLMSKHPQKIRDYMGEHGPPGCFICIF